MATKVTIPREVADAIEGMRRRPENDNAYITGRVLGFEGPYDETTAVKNLRKIPFDTLMAALINGYEREKTPEETIAEIYCKLTESARQAQGMYNGDPTRYTMAALTLKRVLGLLDIVIPGVNDTEVSA